jgi:hypothetical protein
MTPEPYKSLGWFGDVVVFPLVGLMFICGGLMAAVLGRARFNDQELSYADQPSKFVALIAGSIAVGLVCAGFPIVRWWLTRRRDWSKEETMIWPRGKPD